VGRLLGPAHGHVGQLTPATVHIEVGTVGGLALAAVGGDGIAVSQALGREILACEGNCRSSWFRSTTASRSASTASTTARSLVTRAPSAPGVRVTTWSLAW
jgi:hypothetical protein